MRRIALVVFLLIGVLVLAACANSTEPEASGDTPSSLTMPESVEINTDDDVPRIKPKEAKDLVDSGLAVIVDARAQDAYDEEHIAGSLPRPTVPISQLGEVLDPELLIITYCT